MPKTKRLILREMTLGDANFVVELLNTPKFIRYIGDRGVRTIEQAHDAIENLYRKSYREHGFGVYVVEMKPVGFESTGTLLDSRVSDLTPVGICGFVKRDMLPGPDIGFAFLPQFEGKGYGFESAAAILKYGQKSLGFTQVLAITSQDNDASVGLLEKLGFSFDRLIEMPPDNEVLKLFAFEF